MAVSERAFCFFAINALMSAYVALPLKFGGETLSSGEQNLYYTVAQAVVLLGVAGLCLLNPGPVLAVASRAGAMNAFILLAICSAAWSVDPIISLRRAVTITVAASFAYYLLATRPMDAILRSIALSCVIAAVASAVIAVAFPQAGIMAGDPVLSPELIGAWSGVFTHKNELGVTMMLGTQCCAWLALNQQSRRLPCFAGALLCFAVVLQTRSATAEIGSIAVPFIFAGLRVMRLPGLTLLWAAFGIVAACLLAALLGAVFLDDITGAIGKDASLTGRIPLWSALISLADGRFLQGYGYMAFFTPENPEVELVHRAIGWDAPEAHQGYLDIYLQLGLPGLALAIVLVVRTVALALAAVRAGGPAWGSLAVVVMLTLAVTSTVETVLLRAGNIYSLMVPLFYAGLQASQAPAAIAATRRPGAATAAAGPARLARQPKLVNRV